MTSEIVDETQFTSENQKALLQALRRIPHGYVTTYKALARYTGINSAQAVGQLLKRNPCPDLFPCYKVVKSDGTLGGFNGTLHSEEKVRRLKQDGIQVIDEHIPDFENLLFDYSDT
jgi:O-6-methylguanine DNA methyltransferase